jgi:hypothetical protein
MSRRRKTRRSRKARKPQSPKKPAVSSPAPKKTTPARPGAVKLAVVFLLVVSFVAIVWVFVARGSEERIELPPPHGAAAADQGAVAFTDFAGSESCEECHEEQYEEWLGSTHGNAGGLPSPDVIIPPFDGQPIRFSDAVVTPSMNARGEYIFTVVQQQGEPVLLHVDGAVGRAHMFGGGTQGFVSVFDDGTVRFLPFDFQPYDSVWFCNTGEEFTPISEHLRIGECIDWPPFRILGSDGRGDTCQECHGSQILLEPTPGTDRYETKIRTLDINCESCHGPSMRHVELAKDSILETPEGIALEVLETRDKDGSLAVCFQCHALKGLLEPGYLQGKPLERYYTLRAWLVGETPYFPDGRMRTFGYQQNHVYSDCYVNGSMTCVDCHDPHSQQYRDIWGRPLEDRFSDEQCTDCHASKAERPEEHTFHEPGTAGSKCVDCHMPYLQQPKVGHQIRYARSDHTIPIPRPGDDDRMGIVNACSKAECHADSTVQALARITQDWYGELKPRKAVVEGLLEAPEVPDRLTAARLLLHPEAQHPIAQIAALGYFVQQHLQPDMPRIESEIVTLLKQLAEDENIDVQAVALATLHLARGEDRETRLYLAEQLRSLGERDALVPQRWALVLQMLGSTYWERGESQAAIRAYQKGIEVAPRDATLLLNLAWSYNAMQDFAHAVEYYERALEVNPDQPLVRLDLRVARENLESRRR